MSDNDLIRRGDAKQCCTNELRNTAHLLSNPPQSSAAWNARNAINAIPAVQPTVSPDVAALVEALEFYAAWDNWTLDERGVSLVDQDEGKKARAALARVKGVM